MKPDNLPLVVPIVPLEEPLLLPGTVVPFTADEEWLQSLAEEVLAGDGYVGVVQVMEPETDLPDEELGLFTVGCLGRMEMGRPENPDEFLVGGVVRFRVIEWLEPENGYPRARVDWMEFLDDLQDVETGLPFSALREIVRQRVEIHHPDFDFSVMERMAGTEIATALAHALPFCAAERQALMEAPSLRDIEELLLQLMLMAGPGSISFYHPPLRVC
ncbi:MAG TPA: LON peptidase substrate-binding domain-containing protein [Thermoanaerobaculia bacterium]|nr:LON peptidase substrate-binding domain-containing protein [Thermoanaerobaculia bacterium]